MGKGFAGRANRNGQENPRSHGRICLNPIEVETAAQNVASWTLHGYCTSIPVNYRLCDEGFALGLKLWFRSC